MAASLASTACRLHKEQSPSLHFPSNSLKFIAFPSFSFIARATARTSFSASFALTPDPASVHLMDDLKDDNKSIPIQRPDSFGRFGQFGGKYVPETLKYALTELEAAFHSLAADEEFQKELSSILRDYVGRETPLYFAERLTEHYKHPNGEGPLIYVGFIYYPKARAFVVEFRASKRVSRLEGIIPALETSHALAYLEKLCPSLPDGTKVVVNCSGWNLTAVAEATRTFKSL